MKACSFTHLRLIRLGYNGDMLTAAIVFLIISIIAGALGLGRTASVAATIAQAIFGVFLIFFLIFVILFLLGVSVFR